MQINQDAIAEQPDSNSEEWRRHTDQQIEALQQKINRFESTVERRMIELTDTVEVMLECTTYLSGAIERLRALLQQQPPPGGRPPL